MGTLQLWEGGGFTLSWEPVPTARGYVVYRDGWPLMAVCKGPRYWQRRFAGGLRRERKRYYRRQKQYVPKNPRVRTRKPVRPEVYTYNVIAINRMGEEIL